MHNIQKKKKNLCTDNYASAFGSMSFISNNLELSIAPLYIMGMGTETWHAARIGLGYRFPLSNSGLSYKNTNYSQKKKVKRTLHRPNLK